jgi:FtsH-binding integral membrane protein
LDHSIGLIVGFFVVLIILALCGFWIWSIVDCATKEPDTGNTKLVWILIILFTGVIGSAVYLIVRRPKRWAELGR